MAPAEPLRGVALGVLVIATLSGVCQAQGAHPTSLAGSVADPLSGPLVQAEVIVRDTTNVVVATARTDTNGMFLVRGLAHDTRYHVLSRRIGYAADTVTVVTQAVQDSLWLAVTLRGVTPRLDVVKVEAKTHRAGGLVRGLFRGLTAAYHSALRHGLVCGAKPAGADPTPGLHWDWGLNNDSTAIIQGLVKVLCAIEASRKPPASKPVPVAQDTTAHP